MIRKIIKIDGEKCSGCGLCAEACHEAAIAIVDGKAKLLRDDYCDGLGNCLPVCPTGAISFEEREAASYDEEAVRANLANKEAEKLFPEGCPGAKMRALKPTDGSKENDAVERVFSELQQWPVQIKLVPVKAPYFENAHLLVTADCAAYACGSFHSQFMKNKITVIGCPKLDDVHYGDKLTEIIAKNNIRAVTVVQMEVPCCSGIEKAVYTALLKSCKSLPLEVITLTTGGEVKSITEEKPV